MDVRPEAEALAQLSALAKPALASHALSDTRYFLSFSSLRAKGTLISEPRFSTPREVRFFPREKGKMAFVEGFSLKMAVFPFLAWEKSHLAGGRKSGLTN